MDCLDRLLLEKVRGTDVSSDPEKFGEGSGNAWKVGTSAQLLSCPMPASCVTLDREPHQHRGHSSCLRNHSGHLEAHSYPKPWLIPRLLLYATTPPPKPCSYSASFWKLSPFPANTNPDIAIQNRNLEPQSRTTLTVLYILYCRFDLGLKTLSVPDEPKGFMIWVSRRKSLKRKPYSSLLLLAL